MLVISKPCPLNCLIHRPSVQNEGTDQVLDHKVDAFKAQVQDRKGKDSPQCQTIFAPKTHQSNFMLKVKYKLFEEKYYLPGLYETHILQATNDKGYGNGGLYGDYNFVHKSVE